MPYGKHENPEVALIEQSVYQINRIILFPVDNFGVHLFYFIELPKIFRKNPFFLPTFSSL